MMAGTGMIGLALAGLIGAAAAPFPIDRLVGTDPAMHTLITDLPVCPEIPEPVVRLRTESRYYQEDAKRATIDPERDARYKAAIAPVRRFLKAVTSSANKSVELPFARMAWAECTLGMLSSWADADALLEMETHAANLLRGGQLATLTLATLQIRDAVGGDPRFDEVVDWLTVLAEQSRDYVNAHPRAGSSRANHRYWNGLGVAAAGALAGDKGLLDWGIESARVGLAEVTEDGYLPLELARGKRARDYHLFALAPLVMTAEIAATQGIDLYVERDRALERLGVAVLRTIADPSDIAALAGEVQQPFPKNADLPPAHRLAWLEPFVLRTGNPEASSLLERVRPVSYSALGGDLTLLFSKGLNDAAAR